MTIKRYDVIVDNCGLDHLDPSDDGELVRYVDHAHSELDLRKRLNTAFELLSVNMPMPSADEAEDWTEAVTAFVNNERKLRGLGAR